MLLSEKYLRDKNVTVDFPIPDRFGLFAYAYRDTLESPENFNFIYYQWENGKNHPGYYVFKYYSVVDKPLNHVSYLTKDLEYVNWSEFFGNIKNLKENILDKKHYLIPKTAIETENALWRAFLRTQDYTLASIYNNLPELFFNSVDLSLSVNDQAQARLQFLEFIKDKYFVIYNAWIYFMDFNVKDKFCTWFYNYCNGSI